MAFLILSITNPYSLKAAFTAKAGTFPPRSISASNFKVDLLGSSLSGIISQPFEGQFPLTVPLGILTSTTKS